MAVGLKPPDALLPIRGVRLGAAAAGIRKPGREDLVLIALDAGTAVAAVFTRNAFAAAPVQLARQRLKAGGCRALLINSGNANAGTGAAGLAAAAACCEAAGQCLNLPGASVLPFSTGVIGAALPVDRIESALPRAGQNLAAAGWLAAARAIMTTDTIPKGRSRQLPAAGGETITLTGIAKGAGMIRPDMATMLAFVGTDAAILQTDLQVALQGAVAESFHCITVDGDTSTNDACLLFATGRGARLAPGGPDWDRFQAALTGLCQDLAQAIVRDGEGATKFITVQVAAAVNARQARAIAFAVAQSPLVKTACFAGDPNWGRILAAVGRAGSLDLDIGRVGICLDEVAVVSAGEPAPGYREADAAAVMAGEEFTIHIDLGCGNAGARVWTCDLGYDYIKINAEYRS